MDIGNVLVLVSIASGVLLTVAGWVIHRLWSRLDVAEALIRTKDEMITELRRQNDRFEITAALQDRFLASVQIPSTRQGGQT